MLPARCDVAARNRLELGSRRGAAPGDPRLCSWQLLERLGLALPLHCSHLVWWESWSHNVRHQISINPGPLGALPTAASFKLIEISIPIDGEQAQLNSRNLGAPALQLPTFRQLRTGNLFCQSSEHSRLPRPPISRPVHTSGACSRLKPLTHKIDAKRSPRRPRARPNDSPKRMPLASSGVRIIDVKSREGLQGLITYAQSSKSRLQVVKIFAVL